MSETNDYAVLAEGLVRNFGHVRAVDGIDLAVPKGEVYGFLGPNGAGKTTVVRILTTLLMPHGGRTMVAGKDVVREPKEVRLRVGAALQEAALDPKQTGREILRLQGWLFGMSGREVDRRLAELESLMDIGDAINRFVGTYSGGMKRRLDLAAALNPRSRSALPRRADNRTRPHQPQPRVGRGPPHQQGARRHNLPDHPVL